jgi:two-component system, sporulation sensor kinase A
MVYNEGIEQESLFWQAFHFAPIGMALISLEGKALKANPMTCSLLGYTEEELKDLYIDDYTHPDDLDLNVLVKGEVLDGVRASYSLEKRFFHKNGHIVYGLLSIILVRDNDNSPLFFISQLQDISEQKEAEKKLLEIKKQYKLITENSIDIISKYDSNINLLYISDSCLTLTGYRPEELVGKSVFEYCHPDDIGDIFLYHQNMLNLTEVHRLCYRIKRKDRKIIWLETTAKGIFDDKGNLTEVLAFSRDITARKQDELQIKESEERYKSLFENHPDMTFSMDLDGYYTSINQSFQILMGYSKKDLLTKPLNFRSHIFLNSFKKAEHHFKQAANGRVQRFEATIIGKDNIPLDFDVTDIPIIVDDKIVGVFGIARDITSKKKAEKELQMAKDQLASFIDNNVDPILIFNNDDKVIWANESFEKAFGWKSSELIGLYLYQLPYRIKEDSAAVEKNVRLIKEGNPFQSYETVRKRRDGSITNVLISGFPIPSGREKMNGWAINIRDITERKQAEELMIRSEKLSIAGQLAAGIAHEIRNPMTAIKGFIQLIKSERKDKPEYFDIITSEIQRIELILSELLILAKPQTVNISKTEVNSLVKEVITLLNTEAILNNVQMITEFKHEKIYIHCEVNQIKQVCINFIKNAIESMPKGGTLTIQLEKLETDSVLIRFIDEGYGIPPSVLKKLGQPFYTTKEKGTGLGFMVSKKIIENHNGHVLVQSKVNKGSIFEVILPLNQKIQNGD